MKRTIWVCPIHHPAYILRGKWGHRPAQPIYLERVKRTVESLKQGDTPEVVDVTKPAPGVLLGPTIDDVHRFIAGCGPDGVTVDIETAGNEVLVCIGFCRMGDGEGIVIPFRRRGGAMYWPDFTHHRAATSAVYHLLADPTVPKVFHNGQAFDVPWLERQGFTVAGFGDLTEGVDTLVSQHSMYSEMPKGLQFCAILYEGLPAWKDTLDDEVEGKA